MPPMEGPALPFRSAHGGSGPDRPEAHAGFPNPTRPLGSQSGSSESPPDRPIRPPESDPDRPILIRAREGVGGMPHYTPNHSLTPPQKRTDIQHRVRISERTTALQSSWQQEATPVRSASLVWPTYKKGAKVNNALGLVHQA